MSLPLILINGKCEVPIQIISLRLLQILFFEFLICYRFFIKCFFTDGQTHVQLKIKKKVHYKIIVRNLTQKVN